MRKYHCLTFVLFYLLALFSSYGNIPPLLKRVTDLTNTLTVQQISDLEQQIITFEKDHPDGSQIAVLIIAELDRTTTIAKFANSVFNEWQLGKKGKDNGILILISLNDRKLRIEVGYGLEGQLTDLQSKYIVDLFLTPNFKKQDYYIGISKAINAIDSVITDPVNNILEDIVKSEEINKTMVIYAAYNAVIMTLLLLIFNIIKPTCMVSSFFKRFFLLLFISSLLMFAYANEYLSLPFIDLIKNCCFFSAFSLFLFILALVCYSCFQLLITLPLLNMLVKYTSLIYLHKTNKIEIAAYGTTATISSLVIIALFFILPQKLQSLVIFILFIYIFICFFIDVKKTSRSDSSSNSRGSGRRSSGGGFSGGGGRSGGGGSSGSW